VKALVYDRAPARVYWELTRACDLACRHCRAEAQRERAPAELTTAECERVLDALALAPPPKPHVIFTGGDPLKRPDLTALVRASVARGLGVSVAPSATLGITHDVVRDLADAGVSAMSLSVDGPSAAHHDAVRGVLGCFGWTLAAARRIVAAGIPLQINTLVTAETEPLLDDTAKLVASLGAARWSLFFLVAIGRGRVLTPVDAATCERRLRWLARSASQWPFVVSTTEAPHYRRVMIQQMRAAGRSAAEIAAAGRGWGIRDGNGIMFISSTGDITPSGFLPLVAGNVREVMPLDVYRYAPLFRGLRQPKRLRGRCGACEFRAICGGSRARAWAATGDVYAEDPLCTWRAVPA
jgi:radical SAM protein with 4Fe4S-binding SPASM domain